ncbi:unnamed protein product [Boreogadus saida]
MVQLVAPGLEVFLRLQRRLTLKTSRPLAPNRTTQSDYGTHFGLRRDVVPLLWSSRKTSRPLAPNRTTQSDYGTHFGLRRDVVPLLWSSRKTSRPLATNRHIQSDYLAWANKEVETFVCILGEEDVVYDVYVAAAAIDIRPTTKGTVGSGNATSELSWAISPPPYRTFAIRSVPHPAVEKRH